MDCETPTVGRAGPEYEWQLSHVQFHCAEESKHQRHSEMPEKHPPELSNLKTVMANNAYIMRRICHVC